MSINIGERAAATFENNSSEVFDNITNDNGFLMRLMDKGQIVEDTGGTTINNSLMYAENGMQKWYSGLESFNIVEEEVLDAAEWERKFLGTFIYFSGKDKVENRNKHQIFNLIKSRKKVAEQTLKNQVATSLYSDGSSSKQLGGLRLIIDDDPTSAGTIGGIDQVANTFWRNQFTAATSFTKTTARGLMNAQWLTQVRGTDKPDLILAADDMYTPYEESLQENVRYTSTKMADAGFESIKYKTADVVYDDQCPSKRMYFVNTDYMELCTPSDRRFTVGKNRTVTNADYDVIPILFAGALTCSNRSLQGVIIGS
jgi:hypothetical protein